MSGSTVATLAAASLPTLDAWGDLARARAALSGAPGPAPARGAVGLRGLSRPGRAPPAEPPGRSWPWRTSRRRSATLDDLRAFAGALGRKAPGEIVQMPVPHAALWRDAGAREEDAGRAGILGRLLRGEPLWVIVPARGLEAPLPRPAAFRRQVLTLGSGDSVDREALVEHLQAAGYERVETVTGVGQWALRGGIVDVFSPAGSLPVRIELTGDDVESLRTFDPTSQRSTASSRTLLILPMLTGDTEAPARLGDYLPADAPLAIADPALLAPGAPEAPALETLGARPRVECGVLLTDEPGTFRLETRSIEGRARPAPAARAGPRRLAGRGLPGAPPRARSEDRRPAPGDPPGSRARGARRPGPARPRAARGPGGGRACRVRVPGARPRLPHGDRALRAPPDHAPPADLPARGGDRRVHRSRAGRPGRPRRARDRPVHGARHAGGGWTACRLPPPRVRRRRRGSISRSSGWPPSPSTPAPGARRRGSTSSAPPPGSGRRSRCGLPSARSPRSSCASTPSGKWSRGSRSRPTRPGSTSSRRPSRSRRRPTSWRPFAR